jgi:FemAB-related protein (PEP-CTERM system-associated)
VAEDEAARDALAAAAIERGQRLGVGHIELRSECASLADWITKSDLYATFRRELAASESTAMAQVPRKKRADLRKSLNAGLTVELGGDPYAFYAVYAQSVRDLGTPVFPRRLVDAIVQEFAPICELSMVRRGEQPLAALLSFYFRDQILPYYGGAVPKARALHAYDLLYWSLMRRAVVRGALVMDFGRSKRGTGAFAYKTYWGFEPTPLAYQVKLVGVTRPPEVNPLNPKYRHMMAIWQRLPLAVANRLGPMLARQIG